MAKISSLIDNNSEVVYPQTKASAVLLEDATTVENAIYQRPKLVVSDAEPVETVDPNTLYGVYGDLGQIQTEDIADSVVTTDKIANASVPSAKLASGAVTTAKIAAGAVTASQLGGSSVTTAKIADKAVTTAKITPNAVTHQHVFF